MNNLFSGLKSFELLLVVCGMLFFVTLIFLLVRSSIKNKPFLSLLPFFLLPIAMIGYPSIKSIEVSRERISIVKQTEHVENNPRDTVAREKLENQLQHIDGSRIRYSAEALTEIATAQSALGNYDTALAIIDRALNIDKNTEAASKTKFSIEKKLEVKKDFETNMRQIQSIIRNKSTVDSPTAEKVAEILSTTQVPVYTDAESSLTFAKALAVLKEKERSLQEIRKIAEVKPLSSAAITLKNNLQQDSTETAPLLTPETQERLRNSALFRASDNKLVVKPQNAQNR